MEKWTILFFFLFQTHKKYWVKYLSTVLNMNAKFQNENKRELRAIAGNKQ